VRNVQDVYLEPPRRNATYWLGERWRRSLMREFLTTDHFYMPSTAHDVDWHRLADRLDGLTGTTIEVGLHPGTEEEWRRLEQQALPAFVDAVQANGHELIGWRELEPSVARQEGS
jgi:hypothetical protein